jgi:hypothetical protein
MGEYRLQTLWTRVRIWENTDSRLYELDAGYGRIQTPDSMEQSRNMGEYRLQILCSRFEKWENTDSRLYKAESEYGRIIIKYGYR